MTKICDTGSPNFRSGSWSCDNEKTALAWGCVRAFQLVSSTPMNGPEMTLAPFKIGLCATEAWRCMARGLTPPSLAHVGWHRAQEAE